jgi:D-alanine-D-alanine ligase
MRIGIFFGGPAREREISYAGGKTAMENMDKQLFSPVPVFVDSLGNFIILKTELLYKAAIREFYPPASKQPQGYSVYVEALEFNGLELENMIAEIGQRIYPHQFAQYFDFAFIAMHGPAAEDGSIQGLLEWHNMPYSGPGILGSGVGIDKIAQNDLLNLAVGLDKRTAVLQKTDWDTLPHNDLFELIKSKVGLPFVVKAPHQGSSIGVAFVKTDSLEQFEAAVAQCLFVKKLTAAVWNGLSPDQKRDFVQKTIDLDTGIGLPLLVGNELIKNPLKLIEILDSKLENQQNVLLSSLNTEDALLIESFVDGQEFSCGVIQRPNGQAVALPPTEIVKADEVFDFNSKYKPGATRKRIPVLTSLANNQKIQETVKLAFEKLGFLVCTRIDGFLKPDGTVVLHDPNTIPGMSPTSLIFKQMAEVGLNVTEAITYFIRQSIRERMRSGKNTPMLAAQLAMLDAAIAQRNSGLASRPKVPVIVNADTSENLDEAFAAARKEYGKLAASATEYPQPMLQLKGQLLPIPKHLMFKDFAEDLLAGMAAETHPLIVETRAKAAEITQMFTA